GVRAAREERVSADPHELRCAGMPGQDRLVADLDVARELAKVREDDTVAELAVVADVAIRHHEVVVAEPGRAAALARAEVDRHVLADAVAVADRELDVGDLLVAQVLRGTAEHRAALN